jgi:hypothetical protein
MSKRSLAVLSVLLVSGASVFAGSTDQRQITWNDLSMILQKKLQIVMPDGTRIEGKALAVETDALALQVTKTTNANAYPSGTLLVPRATLKAFDIQRPSYYWRVIGVFVGSVGGAVAGVGIGATHFGRTTSGGPWAAGAAAAVVPVAGYYLGKRADQRVTTYVITQ